MLLSVALLASALLGAEDQPEQSDKAPSETAEVDARVPSQKDAPLDASADAGPAGGAKTNGTLLNDALPSDGDVGWPAPAGVWPREFPKAGPWDFATVGTFSIGTVVLQVTYTPATVPRWSGGILLDDWARRVLRLSSPTARATAARLSDGLLYVMAALPFVDAWLGAGFTYKRTDVALRLTLLDAEALLATTFITLGGQHLVLRARPFVSLCAHQPTAGECTDGSAQDTSFPSGHTSIAFAVAMLECVNHAHLDTDRTGWNGIVCPLTMSIAGFTGLLRIASDRHFLSDVLVGGLLGAGIGYAVPTLHFAVTSQETKTAILPVLAPGYAGLALSGAF